MPHLTKVRQRLKTFSLSGIYVDDPIDITYLTGLTVSRGVIVLSGTRAWLLLDSRYNLAASSMPPEWTVAFADDRAERGRLLKEELLALKGPVGFDGASVSFRQALEVKELCSPETRLEDAKEFFSILRRPKSPDEIAKLKESCRMCVQGFEYLLTQIKEQVTEKELALKLELFWLASGADRISFEPIIAFGANSAGPHWKTSNTKLEKNSSILIDIGVELNGYQSDMTRVVFFKQVSPLLKRAAKLVETAYNLAAASAKPGFSPCKLDRMVRDYFASQNEERAFLHGLGHGVGLKVHEPPRLNPNCPNEPDLQPGDIITIEPGLYYEAHGGIRLENTCCITEGGATSLVELPLEPFQL